MRALLALLGAALLLGSAACSAQRAVASAAAATGVTSAAPSASAALALPAAALELRVEDRLLTLRQDGVACTIEAADPKPQRLTLALAPPCHLLMWRSPPPVSRAKGGPSDGRPVGTVGEPMAWRYPSAGGTVTLAVIGDAVAEPQRSGGLYSLRQRQGLHCAGSVQGVLVEPAAAGGIRLSAKRAQIGVLCAETGLEEKDFWILAHP